MRRHLNKKSVNLLLFFWLFGLVFSHSALAAQASLSWNANPASENVLGYNLYFGQKAACGDTVCDFTGSSSSKGFSPIDIPVTDLSDSDNPSYLLDGLTEGEWCFSLSAYNGVGESNLTSTTSKVVYDTAPSTSITSPTSAASYSTSNASVDLSGVSSDNACQVESVTWTNDRGGSGSASGTDTWSVSNISLTEGDNLITVTLNSVGGATVSASLTVTYTVPDTQAPEVAITSPTSSGSYTSSSSQITVSGTSSDNTGVTGITWTNSLGGSGSASGTGSWTVTDIALYDGSNVISVTAGDAAGNTATGSLAVSYSAPDITPPAAVSNTTATAIDNQVALGWTTPADSDFAGTMVRYRTDGSYPSSTADGSLVINQSGSPNTIVSYSHTDLTYATTYYYSIFTYDKSENYSGAVQVSATPQDNTPPSFDGLNSAADSMTAGTVVLSWNPASDPSSPLTYQIYYATNSGGQDYGSPAVTTQNTSYRISGLTSGQAYYFVVRAQDMYDNQDSNQTELSVVPTEPVSGTIGYWALENGSGNTAFDDSVNAYDGIIDGATWFSDESVTALDFNGDNDYLDLGDIDTGAPVTVIFRLNADDVIDNRMLLGQLSGGTSQEGALRYNSHELQVWDGSNWGTVISTGIAAETWQHLAITYDGTNVTGYLNGVEKDSYPAVFDFKGVSMGIGANSVQASGNNYDGLIDEVAVYDHALTGQEVQAHFTIKASGELVSDSGESVRMIGMIKFNTLIEGWNLISSKTNDGLIQSSQIYVQADGKVKIVYNGGQGQIFDVSGSIASYKWYKWHRIVSIIDPVNDYRAIYLSGKLAATDREDLAPALLSSFR